MQNAQVIDIGTLSQTRAQRAKSSQRTPMNALVKKITALHSEMEQRLDLYNRVRTLREYRQLLSRFYGIYAPLEPVLWRALGALKDELMLDKRRKAPLLSRDLGACGLSNAQIVGLPRYQRIAPFPSLAEALGRLYVVEGGTLGGQVTMRHFRKLLALKKDAGLGFFNSCSVEVPGRWRTFRDIIAKHVTTPVQQELAATAAVDMFENFHRWMFEEPKDECSSANRNSGADAKTFSA